MKITSGHLYHIYNQGNNKADIFLDRDDYLAFLKKVREHIKPNCNILSYCLMPNHFHFMVEAINNSAELIQLGNIEVSKLGNAFRLLLSQHTYYFNKKHSHSGSLFRQRTKAKCLSEPNNSNLPFICFQYIHQNPLKAKLINKLEDWEFSSFQDFCGIRNGSLVMQELAHSYVDSDRENFINESYLVMEENLTSSLY
jgi:REP-associated tyrosine transposase